MEVALLLVQEVVQALVLMDTQVEVVMHLVMPLVVEVELVVQETQAQVMLLVDLMEELL